MTCSTTDILKHIFKNDDIIRYIYSFGYPEHRKHIKNIMFQIKTDIYYLSRVILSDWSETYIGLPLQHYFDLCYKKDEIKTFYLKYKTCRCCTRHSYYKPDLINHNYNEKQNPCYYDDSKTCECECDCRHMSRILYKSYHNMY
jgi:hypothetical protein